MARLTCYATPGKDKAKVICDAFAAGAGGVVSKNVSVVATGPVAFYGVVSDTKSAWIAAKEQGRDWYYIDNAMFDSTREVYFRATRNRLQHTGIGHSDGKRFAALNIPIKPWRKTGGHILICPQSDQFMHTVVEYPGSWLVDIVESLRKYTDRPLVIRPWTGNKREWYRTLPDDLVNCWAVVTHSSASAITAILSGIPAIVTAHDCIAKTMAGAVTQIEDPPMPDNRLEWAGVVADNQWTAEEFKKGVAWQMLNR